MKQNDKYLAEGLDILNREFGQPLPTLEDTMKAHKLKKEGGPGSGPKPEKGSAKDIEKKAMMQKTKDDAHYKKQFTGESITEGPSDVKDAKKALSMVVKQEQKFRKQMFALEQVFLQDPTKGNDQLAKDIKKSYKDGVTKFMRDSVLMVKGMK